MAIQDSNTLEENTPIASDLPFGAEDCFIVKGKGFQVDPMLTAISRAQAVLLLLSCQFDGDDCSRISDRKINDVIDAVRGELALLEKLVEHGSEGEIEEKRASVRPQQQPNPEVEQMAVLFSEIGSEAHILEQMLLEHSQEASNDRFHATLTVTQKIGYLADKGAAQPGGIISKGGAEEWFLPPSFHWASESQAGSEA